MGAHPFLTEKIQECSRCRWGVKSAADPRLSWEVKQEKIRFEEPWDFSLPLFGCVFFPLVGAGCCAGATEAAGDPGIVSPEQNQGNAAPGEVWGWKNTSSLLGIGVAKGGDTSDPE